MPVEFLLLDFIGITVNLYFSTASQTFDDKSGIHCRLACLNVFSTFRT